MVNINCGNNKTDSRGVFVRRLARLLTTTALSAPLMLAAQAVMANDATVGGVSIPVGPGFNLSPIAIWVTLPAAVTNVTINTEPLSGPFNAIWVTALNAPTNVNITAGNTVTSTAGTGVLVSTLAGPITVTSAAPITGFDYAVRLGLVGGATGDITSTTFGLNSALGVGVATATFGTTIVTDTGTIASGNTGIWTIGAGGNTTVNANVVTSTANYGIFSTSTTGSNTITTTGAVTGFTEGVAVTSTSGNNTLNAAGLVTGGAYGVRIGTVGATTGNITSNTVGINSAGVGIATATFGTTSVTDTGTIASTNTGIWTIGVDGNTTVNANTVTSTANYGIYSTSLAGNNTITTTGAITGATNGIAVASTSGNNVLSGSGTSTVTGGVEGIYINPTTTGNASISNFASITGDRAGIWTVVGTGSTNIQGNGPITGNGNYGILSGSLGGPINIGNTATNGAITGAIIGIDARTIGAGDINLTTNQNVTGNATWGAYLGTVNGNVTSNINAATVSGVTRGYEAQIIGSGNATTNIAAGSIVQATGAGGYGLLTGVTGGVATTNNAGLIRNATDSGAAGVAGGDAIWNYFGTNVVNNTGRIVGRIHTNGSVQTTINNQAAGVWTPGTGNNNFGGANDLVSNSGLINVRSGDTVLTGLENLRNNSGGIINMQYGPSATDTLSTVGFSPQAGSILSVNTETGAANGVGDYGGQGRGDTVLVFGAATPAAASTINIANLGASQTTLTGSIALVDTAAVDVVAPAPGAQLTASTRYLLGTHNLPQFAAKYKYTLVEDAAGGVFLVWQPNITAETMGAYFGGRPGSASAGAAAAGKFAGMGGLGGSASGGAVGAVGDAAAGNAGQQGFPAASQGRVTKGGTAVLGCAPTRQPWTVFLQGDLSQSNFKGGGSSNAQGATFGIERDLSGLIGNGCSTTVAAGIFGTYGGASTGSNSSTSQGLGAYVRASTSFGLYGAAIALFGKTETDMRNAIFGSTATQKSNNQAYIGTIGYVHRFNGGQTWLDVRGSYGFAHSNGRGFTDTVGIIVDGTKDEIKAITGTVGLHHAFTPTTTGFIRAGVRQLETSNSATAFGITVSGKGRQTSGIAEIGLSSQFVPGVTLSASGFGEQSKSTRTLGGNVRLSVKF